MSDFKLATILSKRFGLELQVGFGKSVAALKTEVGFQLWQVDHALLTDLLQPVPTGTVTAQCTFRKFQEPCQCIFESVSSWSVFPCQWVCCPKRPLTSSPAEFDPVYHTKAWPKQHLRAENRAFDSTPVGSWYLGFSQLYSHCSQHPVLFFAPGRDLTALSQISDQKGRATAC